MKKIKLLLTLAFVTLTLTSSFSQQNKTENYLVTLGVVDSLSSKILEETKAYYVQLPRNYENSPNRSYPVAYILDGEVLLNSLYNVHEFYSGGFMPEMILVGLSNSKNRTFNLTTSKVTERFGMPYNEPTGGASAYTDFLEKELIPLIDKKYRTTGYRTLIGHSYGGLFTINTLLKRPHLFENYLAIDPSLDWDNQKLIKEAQEIFQGSDFKGKSVFMSLNGVLHMMNADITIDNVMEDTSEETVFARSNITFSELMKSNENKGLTSHWKFYPEDYHGTLQLPSIMDGLKQLFSWFQMENVLRFNDPETSRNELLGIIKHRAQKLENHFGYKAAPYPEDLLNMSGYMNMDWGKPEKSLMFFKLGVEYFPKSANSYDSLADYYIAQKDNTNALKNLKKAFEISGSDYHKNRIEELISNSK